MSWGQGTLPNRRQLCCSSDLNYIAQWNTEIHWIKLVTSVHLPVQFIGEMTGQKYYVDKNTGIFSMESASSSIGKFMMIYFLLVISPYFVCGYSARDPAAADIDNADGLNFDIEDW